MEDWEKALAERWEKQGHSPHWIAHNLSLHRPVKSPLWWRIISNDTIAFLVVLGGGAVALVDWMN